MNEIFDKFIIKIIFTIFICLSLYLYKYAHVIFHPKTKNQALGQFTPTNNKIDSLHFFGRFIGLAFIYATLEFNEYAGILINLFHFFVWSTLGTVLYLASIWILNSIIFYNFEYKDEVFKKKNYTYGIIHFAISICTAFIIKTLFVESDSSIVIFSILWLFSLVIFGFLTKLYNFISPLKFNALMIQKDFSLAYSYIGFIAGITIIFTSAFGHEHNDLVKYLFQIITKILLAFIILPVFQSGIKTTFRIKIESIESKEERIGYSIYEGASFFISALLCSMVISKLNLGTIFPFF